jgi:RNA polymerase sigma-70 factor (ECF subfamily)
LAAADRLDAGTPLRPWLFRIAHNCALDHLRRQAVRRSVPIDAAATVADDLAADPVEALARQEAIDTALSRFTQLPVLQRSAVILKDVLGHSLEEISGLLDLSVNSVKAALGRGRIRLREINAAPPVEPSAVRRASEGAARFSALFNQRDWDALRSLLAEDVRLRQTTYPDRQGRAEVGLFFTIYAASPAVRLVPAYLEGGRGGEVIAVFDQVAEQPAYLMQVEWRGSQIVRIRDFRHARYILDGADLVLAAPRGG